MKFDFRTIALFLFSCAPLAAQNGGDIPQVSLTIDFVAWGEDLHGLEVRSEKKSDPVSALAFRYSEPYRYSGPQVMSLAFGQVAPEELAKLSELRDMQRKRAREDGIEDPGPIAPKPGIPHVDGDIPKALATARETNPELAALITLPANSKRVTILLSPGPQRSLMARLFDDDPSRHPGGTVRVHNLSPHRIAMRTATGKPTELDPGKSVMSPASAETFVYELAYQNNNEWTMQENNLFSVRPEEQVHFIVLRSDASFFTSSDGSRAGFLQTAILRRSGE
jgi:hypothetical protein